ncbi:hypothetical protein P4S73_17340 [Paraglaciecola sp. Hal342]
MSKLLFVGECMLELRRDENGKVHTSFAGDTYNSAVYAKRVCPSFGGRLPERHRQRCV